MARMWASKIILGWGATADHKVSPQKNPAIGPPHNKFRKKPFYYEGGGGFCKRLGIRDFGCSSRGCAAAGAFGVGYGKAGGRSDTILIQVVVVGASSLVDLFCLGLADVG